LWATAKNRLVFYAEYRNEKYFDAHFPMHDVQGLCRYRTLIAEDIKGEGVIRVGKGWEKGTVRQLLPDWHLDKLATLDQKSFIVSGIENTHQWNYVSEKIFDAFAVVGVPLYYGNPRHGVMQIVPESSFVNIYDLTINQAVDKIQSFRPDKNFLDQYRAAQSILSEYFSQPISLVKERTRVVQEIISEFDAL
jgi:hypothetical protein